MKTKRHIIGLIGEKGSGKDTFADYYINRFQTITTHEKTTNRYVTLSFAEPLKQICQILYPQSTANDFENRDLKEKKSTRFDNKSPREIMQTIGTDLFRNHYDEHIWTKLMIKKISAIEKDTNIIITDIRFENELRAIQSLQNDNEITIFKIERRLKKDDRSNHVTEQNINTLYCDNMITIQNNGSIDEFFKQIDTFLFDFY